MDKLSLNPCSHGTCEILTQSQADSQTYIYASLCKGRVPGLKRKPLYSVYWKYKYLKVGQGLY